MKKSLLALVATALFATAAQAQQTTVQTHFQGERITGVSASYAFEVRLVKSDQTKAVVEVNDFLDRHVEISRNADGVVTVGLRSDRTISRMLNRLDDDRRVMRMTLYLPSVNIIRLSGAAELNASEMFTGENVDIQLSGASELERLNISSSRVKLQCSGASEASVTLTATRDLVLLASGASEVDIRAQGLTYSKLGISGASEVEIKGNGEGGEWTSSGASEIDGDEFAVRDLTVTASGVSSATVNVSGTLTSKASGGSSIRYAGNPARVNNTDRSVRPL